MVLNKQSLMDAMRLKQELVELEGHGTVIVSEISAVDYMKLWTEAGEEIPGEKDDNGNPKVKINMAKFTPALLAYSIVDEIGNRLFTDEEIYFLTRSAQGPFMKLAEAAKRINGLLGDEGNDSGVTAESDCTSESQPHLALDTPTT